MPFKYLNAIKNEVTDECRRGLKTALAKCDLVTREEFDIQQAVLVKTRQKLERLEQKIITLEATLKNLSK